jgi:hypothetical protein
MWFPNCEEFMSTHSLHPMHDSSQREGGKIGTQQHNKDRLGSNSGPMGTEDRRKDKYGSVHNHDAQGLLSDETVEVRKQWSSVRQRLRRRRRLGSR